MDALCFPGRPMPEQTETTETRVKIGSNVLIRLDENRLLTFTIGGVNEGDPDRGIISCDTPLAKALLGRQAGEAATYAVNDQTHRAQIVKIE